MSDNKFVTAAYFNDEQFSTRKEKHFSKFTSLQYQ